MTSHPHPIDYEHYRRQADQLRRQYCQDLLRRAVMAMRQSVLRRRKREPSSHPSVPDLMAR